MQLRAPLKRAAATTISLAHLERISLAPKTLIANEQLKK